MPPHAIAGHVTVIVAPLTALLALVYAARPAVRRAVRPALVAAAVLAAVLVVWAGQAGEHLWDQLKTAAQAAGQQLPPAVQHHAKGSDALAVAVLVLAIAVLCVVWGALRPGRGSSGGARVAAAVLVLAGAAVLVTTGTVLVQAMQAVWSTQGLWSA